MLRSRPDRVVLYWQLIGLGVHCDVVAPSLVPTKAGDRVKTDRRDAEKLARSYRAGDLTPVWVPDAEHEALRDLVRAREAAKKDQLRARHRLGKFLLRHGRRRPEHLKMAWTAGHIDWIRAVRFELTAHQIVLADYLHEVERVAARIAHLNHAILEAIRSAPPQMRAVIQALQALRGVAAVSAATIVAEVGQLSRFENPRQLMGYRGWSPANTRPVRGAAWARSRRPATRTCGASSSRPPGPIASVRPSAARCVNARLVSIRSSPRLRGGRKDACTTGIARWRPKGRTTTK